MRRCRDQLLNFNQREGTTVKRIAGVLTSTSNVTEHLMIYLSESGEAFLQWDDPVFGTSTIGASSAFFSVDIARPRVQGKVFWLKKDLTQGKRVLQHVTRAFLGRPYNDQAYKDLVKSLASLAKIAVSDSELDDHLAHADSKHELFCVEYVAAVLRESSYKKIVPPPGSFKNVHSLLDVLTKEELTKKFYGDIDACTIQAIKGRKDDYKFKRRKNDYTIGGVVVG
jgi:hypothetical protein